MLQLVGAFSNTPLITASTGCLPKLQNSPTASRLAALRALLCHRAMMVGGIIPPELRLTREHDQGTENPPSPRLRDSRGTQGQRNYTGSCCFGGRAATSVLTIIDSPGTRKRMA